MQLISSDPLIAAIEIAAVVLQAVIIGACMVVALLRAR